MCSDDVLSAWYIFAVQTNTRDKTEKYNRKKSMLIKIRYPNTVMVSILFVQPWWIIDKFGKAISYFWF